MRPIILSLFDHPMVSSIAERLSCDVGKITSKQFPDKETYLRLHDDFNNRDVIIFDSLENPNPKVLPLIFLEKIVRELGSNSVGLCAPYLSYMRQDKQFHPGEGNTSEYFAGLLSEYFDWLVTVDPHLHRHQNLSEIYTIANTVLHATSILSTWIKENIDKPVLIGPDSESEQWVAVIAKEVAAPYMILEKVRHGDYDVEVSIPEIAQYLTHTPVLVDDIISTAQTMLKTIKHLNVLKMQAPICIGVHGIFSADAYAQLQHAGVAKIVTSNSIEHVSNQIDLSKLLCDGIRQQLKQ
jgi:ribose-phosphate pyrophosphokinase